MIINTLNAFKKEFFIPLSDAYKDNIAYLIAHFWTRAGGGGVEMSFIENEGPFSDRAVATKRLIQLSKTTNKHLQLVPIVPVCVYD